MVPLFGLLRQARGHYTLIDHSDWLDMSRIQGFALGGGQLSADWNVSPRPALGFEASWDTGWRPIGRSVARSSSLIVSSLDGLQSNDVYSPRRTKTTLSLSTPRELGDRALRISDELHELGH